MQGLARIDELLQKGKFAKAIDGLRELLSHAPDDPELRSRLADAYRLADNKERALYHFQKAATQYSRAKQPLRAASTLERANQLQPNEPEVLFRWAESLEEAGQTEKLRAVIRRLLTVARAPGDRRRMWALQLLLQDEPTNPSLLLEQLVALAETKRFEEACNHAASMVAVPVDPRILPGYLTAAAKSAPEEPTLGAALAKLGRLHGCAREALALLVPYYEAFPEHLGVLENLTSLLDSLGATAKAHVARIELVKLRARSGDRGPALGEIRLLLNKEPADPVAIEVCALACISFGLQGEATRLWFQLAQLHAGAGNLQGRDDALRRVLELKPDDLAALGWAAEVLRERGMDHDAELLERRRGDLLAQQNPVSEELPDVEMATDPGSSKDRAAPTPPPPEQPADTSRLNVAGFGREYTLGVDDNDVVSEEAAFEFVSQSEGGEEQMPIHANPWMDDTADEAPASVYMSYGSEESRSEVSLATRLIPFGSTDFDHVEETES